MSLPKIEVPTFEVKLPSTGKPVKFRPFLVKEHKNLLLMQNASVDEVSRIVEDLIDVCTFKKLNMQEITNFDIDYLFLNIRAKSIGETVELSLGCEKCEHVFETTIDLTKAEIQRVEGHNKKIDLGEIGIEMKYPKFKDVVKVFENPKPEVVFDLITNSVKAVYTDSEYFDAKDSTPEEITEFLESLTKEQFDKLENFFYTMPRVVQHIETNCPSCGHTNKNDIIGIQNFFV